MLFWGYGIDGGEARDTRMIYAIALHSVEHEMHWGNEQARRWGISHYFSLYDITVIDIVQSFHMLVYVVMKQP